MTDNTIQFTGLSYKFLQIPDWQIQTDEHWCVFGTNGSGKGTLAALMNHTLSAESGSITGLPENICLLSFESQQERYEQELYDEDTDFMDHIDYGTSVIDMLLEHSSKDQTETRQAIVDLAIQFGMEPLFDRGFRLLSSGEAKKVLLLKEVFNDNELIILDEPYEGLDLKSYDDVNQLLQKLTDSGKRLLLFVNRLADIPDWISHLAIQHQGKFLAMGQKADILNTPELEQLTKLSNLNVDLPPPPIRQYFQGDVLVKMTDTSVTYSDFCQFQGFNWQLERGKHSIITGPNGAGKSTLLQLITGDHAQCYGNNLEIFGIKRGSGESIWDIKKHIGIISSSLHRDYRAQGNALTTIISGLYDSIGLYSRASLADKQLALQWLDLIGLRHLANKGFRQLSFGQQRLVLIARGLIKQPTLLILDEPTQGLDDINRHLVLAFIEKLAVLKQTTMLFVSHRQDEHLPVFKQQLNFVEEESGEAIYRIEVGISA